MSLNDLRVHEVLWCHQHGHPLLTLHLTGTDRYFAVSMGLDDAASLASMPASHAAAGRARLYTLLESSISGLGGRLRDVQLVVGDDAVLRAEIHILGPRGELTLPAHFADGIAFAHRHRVPLRMAAADVDRVPPSPDAPHPPVPDLPDHSRLQPFRDVLDTLDLEDFGPPA
jgi:bifunctional DNase/RNase